MVPGSHPWGPEPGTIGASGSGTTWNQRNDRTTQPRGERFGRVRYDAVRLLPAF